MTSIDLLPLPLPDEIRAGTVPALFAQVVEATPGAVAVRDARNDAWTFAELHSAAIRFADMLRPVVPWSRADAPRVGLHLAHGVPMIVAQLGASVAGCCYVPLDPTYPQARLRLMADIAELDAVVTDPEDDTEWTVPRVDAPTPERHLAGAAGPMTRQVDDPDRSAYILFTSGSTGRPKGVLHTHRSMLHGIANHISNMGISPADRVTVLTSFSFDMAVSDLYSALLAGACAVPLDVRRLGVPGLARGLRETGATVYHSTPTVFRLLVAQGEPFRSVRLSLLGGEPVHRDDVLAARGMFAPDGVFVNGYGFTEASFVVQQQVRAGDPIDDSAVLPLGHPLFGYDVRVEDVGPDGVGELVVESNVLAKGYVGDVAQTRARFGLDGRTYRPGDRVHQLPDGRLAFAGRTDTQVKINGVRVELAEVQVALERQPDVARAVVTTSTVAGADVVVAHVQAAPTAHLTDGRLRSRLREELPDAMIPSHCEVMDELPLTPTGKVDVNALRVPRATGPRAVAESTHERIVLSAWTAAVGADPGGLDVPFFEAGGGSLALARLHQELRARLPESPSPAELLGAGTVRGMARLLGPDSCDERRESARDRAAARAGRRGSRRQRA